MAPILRDFSPIFSKRSAAAAAFGDSIFFFGGVGGAGTESILDIDAELWRFDTSRLAWERIDVRSNWPSARRCAGWTQSGDRLLLWGGSGKVLRPDGGLCYNFSNDLWELDPTESTWIQLETTQDHRLTPIASTPRPAPRYTPVFEATSLGLLLFGGYTEDRLGKRKLNDAWIRNHTGWALVPPAGPAGYAEGCNWPGLRYGCMSASDGDYVYVCGGFSDDGDHIDLWRFSVVDRRWTLLSPDNAPGPEPRYSAAFAVHEGRLTLFGGRSRRYPKKNFNDLWVFNLTGECWERVSDHRTPHRYDSGAQWPGYHAKSSVATVGVNLYLWGGEGLHGHVSDFWRLDLQKLTWTMVQSARPDDPVFW
jgi:N-acetylneuraminic acid mutarotase